MRVTAAICLSLVMTVVGVHGNTMFNRLTGPLDSDSDRDTQQASVAGTTPHDANGFLVAIPTGVYNVFGTALDSLRCFQIGYCLGGATDPGTTTATVPAESPANTGMATTFTADVIFAPFIFDILDTTHSYTLEYRVLDYTNPYHRHDIERLVAEKFTALNQDLNTAGVISSHQGVVVTWKIFDGTDTNTFQLCLLYDETDTYVFYIYGDMPIPINGQPRGYLRGAAATDSARICSPGDAMAPTNADAVLPEADLPLNSNYKCGKPGVYIFKATGDGAGCSGAATDCSANYASATPNPNCNVTSLPVDTCLESHYCSISDPGGAPDIIDFTLVFKWPHYEAGKTYIQALNTETFWPDVALDPTEEQEFVVSTAAPHNGNCGKLLAGVIDSLSLQIDTTDDLADRCGIHVVAGPPQAIYFSFKIFEWDGTGTAFGPNAMFDKWGDLILYGACFPGDTPVSISQTPQFNDASTPTVLPARPREITFEVVDDIDDTNAQVLPSVQIGRSYFLRICFDRGVPYNPQADPFGIFVQSCSVSNIETFVADGTTFFVQEFITYDATADTGCPITDGDITGPLYMNSDFKVRSDATAFPAYTPTDAGFPQTKWCLYTDAITAARWNKFTGGALIDKLWFQCTVGFCTKFDHGATPSDADRCTDHCAAVKRRRRSIGNETLPKTEEEVVYTSLTFKDSSEGQPSEVCAADSSDFTIAIATVITLIILISAAILAAILVFRKLMNLTNRLQKEKQFS